MGVDVIHPVQPEVMELSWLKSKFGDELAFFGCFSAQKTLPYESPASIREKVKQITRIMDRKGGFIISPGIGLLDDIPLNNALAFIDAVINNKGVG